MADSIVTEISILSAILKLKRTLRTERTVFLGAREISPLFHFFGGHLILECYLRTIIGMYVQR